MMKIQLFCNQNPVQLNQVLTITVGYYAADYSLTDVTISSTITIQTGNLTQLTDNTFLVNDIGSIIFSATYTNGDGDEFENQISLFAININYYPNVNQLVAAFNKMLPSGYNPLAQHSPADIEAQCNAIYEWYQELSQLRFNIYPLYTDNFNDYNFELGIPYNNQNNQVLQLFSNLPYIQLTPYQVSNVISKYIYLLTGNQIYVAVQELPTALRGNWLIGITGRTEIGVTTTFMSSTSENQISYIIFDYDNPLTAYEKELVINLISKIARIDFYTVLFNQQLADLGYTYDIGETYIGDIRNYYRCAFAYDVSSPFFKSLGYRAETLDDIVSIEIITPAGDLNTNTIVPLQIIGTYISGGTVDVTIYCMYNKDPVDSNLIKILPQQMIVGNNTGSLDVEFYLPSRPTISTTITWNII